MREVAFSIIDLNGKAWPYLLDVDRQIGSILPGLAKATGMPEELNYVLIPQGSNLALDGRRTIAEYRIPPGAQLYLRPLRDALLKQLLDKLYEEARDEIKDRLIDMAKDRLMKIMQLDPAYPDSLHLREQVGFQPQAPIQQNAGRLQQPVRQQMRKRSSAGCVIGGLVGGGALLVVLFIVGALILNGLFNTRTGSGSSSSNNNEPVLGTGDVQITLRWTAPVDLDLHVVDPNGEEIWYNYRYSNSGGNLDVDANAYCSPLMPNPVENVYWPTNGAPWGTYQVYVVYFSTCDYSGTVDYQVTVKLAGQTDQVISGTLRDVSEEQLVISFNH